MANHTARAALAACLFAATVAAQAPASEDNRLRGYAPASSSSSEDWIALGQQAPQGEDYSLHRLFLEHHGDFMNRRERFNPQLELRASWMPNQHIYHEPGSFDMLGYGLDIDAPVLVSTDGYLKFGTYFQGRHYQFSSAFGTRNNPGTNLGDESLYAAGLKFGFGVFLHDNVLYEMEVAPGLWSDLDGTFHHEDFDIPSQALFTFHVLDSLFFKVGARYNQVFEDAPWLPVLGLSWEIVEGFRFDLLAPERFELSFWPSPATGILFGAEVTGAEYHVRTGLAQQQTDPNQGRDDVRVQEVISYLGLMHRMNDYTSIAARAGIVLGGDYDLRSGATGFDPVEGALDRGLFVDVSFGVNF
jgi:hypothetical protein